MIYIRLVLLLKKYWKPILGGLLALILLFFMLPLLLFSSLLPGGDEKDIKRYVEVAAELNLNWKELVAFDMVRLDNELEDADPNDAAYYFLELHYEEFKEGKTRCVKKEGKKCIKYEQTPEKITLSKDIQGKKEIQLFFRSQGLSGNDIAKNISAINSKGGRRIMPSALSVEKAMDNAKFTKQQKEDVRDILESGLLDELFPQFSSIGLLPGMCVGKVSPNGKAKANAKVQSYEPIIKKYAKQFGMEPYVEILKAMMMAESHGEGTDPMQSSESTRFNTRYPNVPGGIKDPDYSIYVGVQELREALKISNYDILTAIQTYNFGPYFATWIKSHGGTYTLELAEKYSNEYLYPNFGLRGTPNHALKVINQFYNDPGCQSAGGTVSPSVIGANGWAWPTKSKRITDTFYSSRGGKLHAALDIGAQTPGVAGDPVWSMADGVVIYSGLITGGGNSVFVDHGNGVVSRYIHLQSRAVQVGQKVSKGTIVGKMGGTGGTRTQLVPNAYPVHLDFQIKINGSPVDPYPYFKDVLK